MVDAAGSTQQLHRTILGWDYYEISKKLDEDGGIFDNLTSVPATFENIKVPLIYTWKQIRARHFAMQRRRFALQSDALRTVAGVQRCL